MNSIFFVLLSVNMANPCATDGHGFCTDPVVTYSLSASEPNPRVRVSCSLGNVLVIQFAHGESLRGDPAIGNAALFKFKLQKEPLQLLLWPTIPEGSNLTSDDVLGETSNVQINLASGTNILMELRIAERSVQRIIFKDPGREKADALRRKVREEVEQELQASFEARRRALDSEARSKALSLVAKGMMKRIHCTDLTDRAMVDLLVVQAHRICHIGDHVYIDLSVHNRARDLFALGKIETLSVNGEKYKPLDAVVEWRRGLPQLKFDQKARAVVVFPVSEETAASEYAVRITENAGKKRIVTLDGIEF